MIKLTLTANREALTFLVKDKEIFYSDKNFGKMMVRCLPPNEKLAKVVSLSRNRMPEAIVSLFKFTEEELKEYEAAKNEEELAQIIIRDAASKGVVLRSKEVVN